MFLCILPLGCVCMQHPAQLEPNPQQVPRCRQPSREDTRTWPEPLETQVNSSIIINPGPKTLFNTSESIYCRESMCNMHRKSSLMHCWNDEWIVRNADTPVGEFGAEKTFAFIDNIQWFFFMQPFTQAYGPIWDRRMNTVSCAFIEHTEISASVIH